MKYFKVIKDNFLWEVGAILEPTKDKEGYHPINDVYKKHEGSEYITDHIIEDSPDYFQRVYKVDLATRVVYDVRERARELIDKQHKE